VKVRWLADEGPIFGWAYFEEGPKTPGSSYRITIHSGD